MTDTLPIEELLMVSHVCISDYSSLVFEYSLLERPVLFYAPDLEQYQDWRGFYYPYEEMTPGPVITGQEELGRCLGRVDAWSGRERIRDFRRKFMEACDGKAARRIADCLDAETGIMKETE